MIKDIDGSAGHTISQKCNIVYGYLHRLAATKSPSELISKFQNLLQQAKSSDPQVSLALKEIMVADPEQFNTFLSQCCYRILDAWIDTPESLARVDRLLDTLNTVARSQSYDRRRKQLVKLIQNYQLSEAYQQLKLVIAIVYPTEEIINNLDHSLATNNTGSDGSQKTPVINSYLIRYTFLYDYLLPENAIATNLAAYIKKLQSDRQQDFEIKLSKHIIYRVRLQQVAKMKIMASGAGKIITTVDNPSLLSERAFAIAMQQYIGKDRAGMTLLERSQRFVAENQLRLTYKVFKQDLYSFLVDKIEPRNNTYQFSSRLKQKMSDIFPQAQDKALNPTQILQTCRQLYSFLIIDPTDNDSQQFAELVANLGTAQVMALLLKITLICPQSKADLARKIYLVAIHYQHQTTTANPWLIKSLEHLLVAFSIYFGKIDVSIAKLAMK